MFNNRNETGWLTFKYSDKERSGLAIGPDTRPGTNNVVVLTRDGVRTFNAQKMKDVVNETVIVV